MGLEWHVKSFEELSNHELYDILRLRTVIFVMEQNCIYLDMDGKDKLALHLFGTFQGKIVAYCRLFDAGITFVNASIGRVVVDFNHRDKKWGQELMEVAIDKIELHFNQSQITIGAQLYLKRFYESLGFVQTSAIYLEDKIEHIKMRKG